MEWRQWKERLAEDIPLIHSRLNKKEAGSENTYGSQENLLETRPGVGHVCDLLCAQHVQMLSRVGPEANCITL